MERAIEELEREIEELEQAINLRGGLHYLTCRRTPKKEVGRQTLRQIGRAETLEHVKLLQHMRTADASCW
jgi:hypothetical protein